MAFATARCLVNRPQAGCCQLHEVSVRIAEIDAVSATPPFGAALNWDAVLAQPLGQLPDSDRVIFCVIRWHSSKSWRPSSAAICIRWATNFWYASRASGTEWEDVSLVPRSDHRFTSDWTRASQPRLACSKVSSSS